MISECFYDDFWMVFDGFGMVFGDFWMVVGDFRRWFLTRSEWFLMISGKPCSAAFFWHAGNAGNAWISTVSEGFRASAFFLTLLLYNGHQT